MNVFQTVLEHLRAIFHRDSPPPRWQILIASFYLGMLVYLLLYQYGII